MNPLMDDNSLNMSGYSIQEIQIGMKMSQKLLQKMISIILQV